MLIYKIYMLIIKKLNFDVIITITNQVLKYNID